MWKKLGIWKMGMENLPERKKEEGGEVGMGEKWRVKEERMMVRRRRRREMEMEMEPPLRIGGGRGG